MKAPPRQIAFARLVLPDGRVLQRQIVRFDLEGKPVDHHPLSGEEPFTEWRNETCCWPGE